MGGITDTQDPTLKTAQTSKATSSGTTAQNAQTAQDVTNSQTGNTASTGTTTQNLTPEQQQLISWAMPLFQQYAANPPKAYEGEQVAGFNPTETTGQQQVLGGVPAQQKLADSAAGANQFLLKDVLSPGSNPALQQYIDTSNQSIWDQLNRNALPQVRGEAVTSGQYGGSRQGIAEGIAMGDASKQAAGNTANIINHAYDSGLDALTKGLSLTGGTQQAQITPGLTTSGVGETQQDLQQKLLDEAVQKYYYNQGAPYLAADQLASIAGSLPGGSTTSTGNVASSGQSNLSGLTNSSAQGTTATTGKTSGNTTSVQSAPQSSPLTSILGATASILPLFF